MTTGKAEVYLIQNTGIGSGEYMWWQDKDACDKWFLEHTDRKAGDISQYSRIYGEAHSRNKKNVSCVHLDLPLNDTAECDYISYFNTDANRWFHAAVVGREFVNDKSHIVHFAIDYVATYFDKIKFKRCFIKRMTGEEPVYANMLPEPISVPVVAWAKPNENIPSGGATNIEGVNADINNTVFVLNTDMNELGEVNNPQVKYLGGFPYGGYINIKNTLEDLQPYVKGVVSKTRNLLSKTTSTASTVQSITMMPIRAVIYGKNPAAKEVALSASDYGVWNKTKNLQSLTILSATGAKMQLDPCIYGTKDFKLNAIFYGGNNGFCRVRLAMGENSINQFVDSPTWGQASFAGTGADGQTISGNRAMQGLIDAMRSQFGG